MARLAVAVLAELGDRTFPNTVWAIPDVPALRAVAGAGTEALSNTLFVTVFANVVAGVVYAVKRSQI